LDARLRLATKRALAIAVRDLEYPDERTERVADENADAFHL